MLKTKDYGKCNIIRGGYRGRPDVCPHPRPNFFNFFFILQNCTLPPLPRRSALPLREILDWPLTCYNNVAEMMYVLGHTQVLYKAHLLYCALFSWSCFFSLEIAKKVLFCALFFEKWALFL